MNLHALDMTSIDDEELLARRMTSEADAFAQLYARYIEPVQRYVRARVRDDGTAEDLTAQIFLQTFRSASSYRGEGSYRSWIFQIARNTIATWSASHQRAEVLVEEIDESSVATEAPEDHIVPSDTDHLVNETLAELPNAQREVLKLRYWRDLSIEEIARVMGRSSGAVRQLLHRARNRFKKKLSAKDISAVAGATGASALAFYSINRRRKRNR